MRGQICLHLQTMKGAEADYLYNGIQMLIFITCNIIIKTIINHNNQHTATKFSKTKTVLMVGSMQKLQYRIIQLLDQLSLGLEVSASTPFGNTELK